jgi:hypothetical protein
MNTMTTELDNDRYDAANEAVLFCLTFLSEREEHTAASCIEGSPTSERVASHTTASWRRTGAHVTLRRSTRSAPQCTRSSARFTYRLS